MFLLYPYIWCKGSVETELIKYWDGSGILLIDGPIYPLPRILTKFESRYGRVYLGLISERVKLIEDLGFSGKVVGVVKRLSKSYYLAKCLGVGVSDEYVATKLVIDRGSESTFIGPIEIKANLGDKKFRKYVGYLVKRVGNVRHVLRIEALDKELLEKVVPTISSLIDVNGTPKPITLADKLCRRLSSSAYVLAWGISPIDPTYEGLEILRESIQELSS